MTRRKGFLLIPVLICVFALFMAATAEAKSVYVIASHNAMEFDAWNIGPTGTVTYQQTNDLQYASAPADVAIWEDPNSDDAFIFITSEGGYSCGDKTFGVEVFDAVTLTSVGCATADTSNLGGIEVDDTSLVVYVIQRGGCNLYVYDWDPAAKTLTATAESPVALPGCTGGMGIALDENADILWVADGYGDGVARAYDVTSWTEVTSMSFTPSHVPVDIAVDRIRGFVYTGSMHAGAGSPSSGSTLISQYDTATGTERTVDLGCEGVGLAVDERTGYVYVTISYYCEASNGELQVWDPSTTPWTQVQATDLREGNTSPAGLAIGNVGYNPLHLTKDDGIPEDGVVAAGANITYTICFDNLANEFGLTGVTIVDTLPAELSFVSATDDGVYDSDTHTVTWDIDGVDAGAAQSCGQLVVKVDSATPLDTIIVNQVTIASEEVAPITTSESTVVGEAAEIEPAGILNPGGGGGSCGGCFINTANCGSIMGVACVFILGLIAAAFVAVLTIRRNV